MVDMVSTSTPSRTPKSGYRLSFKTILALVLASVILAATAGYYIGNWQLQKNDGMSDDVKKLEGQLFEAKRDAAFLHDRFYYNDQLDFMFVMPKNWVRNMTMDFDDKGGEVLFRADPDSYNASESDHVGTVYSSAFVIYKCKQNEYQKQTEGQDKTGSCPGQIIKQDATDIYTWEKVTANNKFIKQLGSRDEIARDFQKLVIPTFQIIR